MSRTYITHRIGPISTGQRQWKAGNECHWAHGFGRIIELTFWVVQPDKEGVYVSGLDLTMIESWIREEWDHRILLQHDDPLIDQFRTLHELGGININVTPEKYGPGLEQSCQFLYDNIKEKIEQRTWKRVGVESVRIWEHENYSATHGTFPSK